jgi:transposase-like protein
MKKTHSAAIKFRAALDALTGQPIPDICQKYEAGESSIHKWKKQLKENGASLFSQTTNQNKQSYEQELAKLYRKIGEQSIELEYLKKIVEH